MHVALITDPSPFIDISMCSSLRHILHSLFFWDEIGKQQTVTYITKNDLNTIAPITTAERRRPQRLFRAWQKFQQQSCPQDSSSCAPSATAILRRTIYRRVSETFTANCIGFTLTVVLRLVCDVGILRAERYFVILDFFFVISDVLEVISET